MKCCCCNKNLKDHESVRRHALTNEFLDMCDTCLKEVPGLPTKMPDGVVHEADPFDNNEEEANIDDVRSMDNVTNGYTLDDD